jgi:hypothetical protein
MYSRVPTADPTAVPRGPHTGVKLRSWRPWKRSEVRAAPKIDQLHEHAARGVVRPHDVLGLDVAVQHPRLVQARECVRDLDPDLHDRRPRQRPTLHEASLEILAGQEAQHRVRHAARLDSAAGDDIDEVLVMDVAQDFGLSQEARARVGRVVAEDLDRHPTPQEAVGAEVQVRHATLAESALHLEAVIQHGAGQRRPRQLAERVFGPSLRQLRGVAGGARVGTLRRVHACMVPQPRDSGPPWTASEAGVEPLYSGCCASSTSR